jgi:hypothetical protein
MMQKRVKPLVIGGAILAALALGGSASAGAATDSSGSSSTTATLQAGSGGASPVLTPTRTPGTAAHRNAEATITADDAAKTSAVPLTGVRGGSVGAMHHVRDSWIHDLYLTDHQQYVRHHQRLASLAG